MAILKIIADHQFSTQGVVIQKGSKKVTLEGKKASDHLKSFDFDGIGLYVFTSKKHEESVYCDFVFFKNQGSPDSVFEIKWDADRSVFDVRVKGTFEKVLDETDVKMLFNNQQQLSDIGFSIRGLMGGDIWNKGFISRIDRFDAKEEDDFFPQIKFEFQP